jgi:DNA-binding transcriptional LysR family regulator
MAEHDAGDGHDDRRAEQEWDREPLMVGEFYAAEADDQEGRGRLRAGLGLTILPGSAREIKAEPGLNSKPIDDPAFTRPVSIIKRSGRTLPPLSEAFLEHLSTCLRAALA